jgi:PleD family two-component response regulator
MNTERPTELPEEKKPQGSREISVDFRTTLTSDAGPPHQAASGARVLIAEDDPVSCQVLATRLQEWGYDAVITRNGHEAMTVMRSANAPALGVLDWMMPGMDGIEWSHRFAVLTHEVFRRG